jgi:hypothetical protein
MPLVFIHGVNVREPMFGREATARNKLLGELVLSPLAKKSPSWGGMTIVNPYWGEHGVQFAWNKATLPETPLLQPLGPEGPADLAPGLELARLLAEKCAALPGLEALGAGGVALPGDWADDPERFLSAVMMPALEQQPLLAADLEPDERTSEILGLRQALLILAADEVARDPQTKEALGQLRGTGDKLDYLQRRVLGRFEERLRQEPQASPPGRERTDGVGLESLGPSEWSRTVVREAGRLFQTALSATVTPAWDSFERLLGLSRRGLTTPLLHMFREKANDHLTRFCGDVFVYLQHRGTKERPGDIPRIVLEALRTARAYPEEPLLVITHSMGGNILYDLLTHFAPILAPNMRVDAWVSVGGQVGLFEEMKLFLDSDPSVRADRRLDGPANVHRWLNIYDPVDPFAFRATPVFARVQEAKPFNTWSGDVSAHSAYFLRPRFYRLVREWLEEGLG